MHNFKVRVKCSSHDSSIFIQHCLLVDRLHSLTEVLSMIREEIPNNKSP